jgi:tetratricopeptide (TPR) repeat protein
VLLLSVFGTLYAQRIDDRTIHSTGEFYFNKPDSLFVSLKEIYNNAAKIDDWETQAAALNQMGKICFHLGHFTQSLEYYLDANKMYNKVNRPELQAANQNDMGILHYYNQEVKQARQCYNNALRLFFESGNHSGIASTYGKIGHLFEKKHQYDSAFYYQNLALQEYRLAKDELGEAKIYENIGSIFEDIEQFDTAFSCFNKAMHLYKLKGERIEHIEVLNNIGDIYRKTGKYRQALQSSLMAASEASKVNEQYQLSAGYRDIAKTYNLLGKNDSAFYYIELCRKYLQEIYSSEGSKQTAFLQVFYEIEKKNSEILQLQSVKKINTIIAISVSIITLLLIVLGYSTISKQRTKIKAEQEINLQNKQMLSAQTKLMEAEQRNLQLERESLDLELRNTRLEEAQLKIQVEQKSKELSTHALHVIQKNQLLEELKTHLEDLVKDDKRDFKKQLKQLIIQINQNFSNESYWEEFKNTFEQIHYSFFNKLNSICPDLTATEIRLISLLKMNMNSTDMATILGISQDSLRVSRYRLRKKLKIEQGENLISFLQHI